MTASRVSVRKMVMGWACLAVAALTGCEQQPGRSSDVVIRDSAGIRVVENHASEWSGRPDLAWKVAGQPRLTIGQAVGEAPYELYSVTGATMLSGQRIAVALGSLAEVRIFDAHGRFVTSFGRRGDGPGELSMSHRVIERGDSILQVWDGLDGRLSLFDAHGNFLRSMQVPTALVFLGGMLGGILEDGTLVTVESNRDYAAGNTLRRDPAYIAVIPEGSDQPDTIAKLAGREIYHLTADGVRMRHRVIFGRVTHVGIRSTSVVYGDTERFELTVLDVDGRVTGIYRKDHSAQPASPALVEQQRETLRGAVTPSLPASVRNNRMAAAARVPARQTLPAFGDIRVDDEDNLWIQKVLLPGDPRHIWHVFDPEGRWLGDVETPQELEARQFGSDFILGTVRDEWDAPQVVLYDLVKPRSTSR